MRIPMLKRTTATIWMIVLLTIVLLVAMMFPYTLQFWCVYVIVILLAVAIAFAVPLTYKNLETNSNISYLEHWIAVVSCWWAKPKHYGNRVRLRRQIRRMKRLAIIRHEEARLALILLPEDKTKDISPDGFIFDSNEANRLWEKYSYWYGFYEALLCLEEGKECMPPEDEGTAFYDGAS
jgi:hypothetical protein